LLGSQITGEAKTSLTVPLFIEVLVPNHVSELPCEYQKKSEHKEYIRKCDYLNHPVQGEAE
jgi:hypothetical protein